MEGEDHIRAPSFEQDIWPGPGAPEEPPAQVLAKLQQDLDVKHDDVSSLDS